MVWVSLVWCGLSSVCFNEVDFLKCSRSASQLSFTNLLFVYSDSHRAALRSSVLSLPAPGPQGGPPSEASECRRSLPRACRRCIRWVRCAGQTSRPAQPGWPDPRLEPQNNNVDKLFSDSCNRSSGRYSFVPDLLQLLPIILGFTFFTTFTTPALVEL